MASYVWFVCVIKKYDGGSKGLYKSTGIYLLYVFVLVWQYGFLFVQCIVYNIMLLSLSLLKTRCYFILFTLLLLLFFLLMQIHPPS